MWCLLHMASFPAPFSDSQLYMHELQPLNLREYSLPRGAGWHSGKAPDCLLERCLVGYRPGHRLSCLGVMLISLSLSEKFQDRTSARSEPFLFQ
jgi:hypothetical protein